MTTDAFPDMPSLEPGTVWLTGAGPGDPGLLTLLAHRGLQQADVVVHDALVDARILALAGPQARLEPAGKRGGRPSPAQPDISARLVALAREGHRVLRLKGGDPFVFGRGGEEAKALRAAGVPFRIVPGITAGVGGLAYAGIPATYRGIGQAVAFVTAQSGGGGLPDAVDWSALARVPTLVCYMALGQVAAVAARLIECGRDPKQPVAVISRATTADQRVVEATLATAAEAVAAAAIEPPAMIVVGPVVGLRRHLDWFPASA
ncbi:MAG TPA: uroporphyrinogen-III C-methyltransferase [Stellaceae bacterium]|nr:uroporphyrinogen-III C-methyltransferase [Stellaceae bacterium]